MAEQAPELITLMEVAKVAGQKRSTVGNWKDRIDGFPVPRDKGPRGPLYDRAEIEKWLADTGRLPKFDSHEGGVGHLVDELGDSLTSEDGTAIIMMAYSLRAVLSTREWSTLASAEEIDLESHFRESILKFFPFVSPLLPSLPLSAEKLRNLLHTVEKVSRKEAAEMVSFMIEWLPSSLDNDVVELPSPVQSLVVGLAGEAKVVYDPAANAGQLLVAMGEAGRASSPRLIGQEKNETSRVIALLNLKIHGLEASVSHEDVLMNDQLPDLRADVIVSIPPWGQRVPFADKLANDVRWVWGAPGPGDGDMAWVQHCLFHLADQGRAVVVLPLKVLFEQGRSARIRQGIIKAGYLESVIALPPGLLRSTKIGFAILVFAKGRPPIGGRPSSTLMINLEEQPTEQLITQKQLPIKLVSEVLDLRHRIRSGHEVTTSYAAIASYEAIAANGFDVTPKRYVMSAKPVASPLEFAEALKFGRESLRKSLENGRQADRQLDQLLRGQS